MYILRRRKLGLTSCREISALSKTGITYVRNDKPLPQDPDEVCIRWGCTSNIPQKNVINTAKAIHTVADKLSFRMLLDEHELCPPTYISVDDWKDSPWYGCNYHGKKGILRPRHHHQGRDFHVFDTWMQGNEAARNYPEGYYISPVIDKVAEYRVFVVSGRVACVAQKTPADPEALAWNVAKGGRFDNVNWDAWPLKAVRVSIEAFDLSGLDFGGVDVMVDAKGEAYILEINSAPSLTSPYRQQCMAKCFDYMNLHGKAYIPRVEAKGGYLKFIHPAISGRAKLKKGERLMLVTPELPVRDDGGKGKQVGWFKTHPAIGCMPDTVCVPRWGMVVVTSHNVLNHQNFIPLPMKEII